MNPVKALTLIFALGAIGLCGCAQSSITNDTLSAAAQEAGKVDRSAKTQVSQTDLDRLDTLYKQRIEASATTDYPVGPGDVIEISCPAMDALKNRTVRVSSEGTIELPLMGKIQAAGLTEDQLRTAVEQALTKYMYKPQVDVFVKQYESREVAVIGAVEHPGLMTLLSPNETILNVLTRAGGMRGSAADELIFIPADPKDAVAAAARLASVADSTDLGAAAGGGLDQPAGERIGGGGAARGGAMMAPQAIDAAAVTQMFGNANSLIIPLKNNSFLGGGRYLSMPVRPGDVIVVPGGGLVSVIGWVQAPGRFNVGSGLTVLGAIGAAGGPMYAADTHDIVLIRSEGNGHREAIPVNLSDIISGEKPDIPVKANDVIQVGYSGLKIGPYIFYSVLTRIGLAAPAVF